MRLIIIQLSKFLHLFSRLFSSIFIISCHIVTIKVGKTSLPYQAIHSNWGAFAARSTAGTVRFMKDTFACRIQSRYIESLYYTLETRDCGDGSAILQSYLDVIGQWLDRCLRWQKMISPSNWAFLKNHCIWTTIQASVVSFKRQN